MNDALLQKIRTCPNLPSLPTIAVQVLQLAQKTDVDIAEIARIISKDPALSSKILRTVNSSFYGRSQHVSTISHALVILGLQSVKTLVLGFSLVTNLTKDKPKGFKHMNYWKRSIYAATAARSLASKFGFVQQEEAFLSALLMDIGMLVLDQVLGEEYGVIISKITSHADLAPLEQATLQITHAEVAGLLTTQWKLPPLLTMPVAFHHSPEKIADPQLRKMAELVGLAGRCADVFADEKPAGAITDVRQCCVNQHKMTEQSCDELLNEIGTRTKEVATLFEINIGPAANFEAILKRANEALVEITLQSQQHASALQQHANTLEEINQQLQKRAITDALTELSNRARFDQFLAEQLSLALEQGKPLSLLMLDLDRFKQVNDKHGHQAGDRVLKAVGKLLASAARTQDLAARYGGEEMVLVMPGTQRTTAAAVAESIRRGIAAKSINIGDTALNVTASIGVASFDPAGPLRRAEHLLKAADSAVYAAKHAGRNCVRVFSLAVKPAQTAVA